MNEFRTLNSTCSTLVPQGAGYENVTLQNQVCATLGGVPGQDWVDGSSYAYLSFEYKWSNMWMVSIYYSQPHTVLIFFCRTSVSWSPSESPSWLGC